uniref:Uncharacterized protein n=1 Tax=Sphaerodactylus townsendi TaxID=933632 RepID=A0ACB8GCI0_9SAUR
MSISSYNGNEIYSSTPCMDFSAFLIVLVAFPPAGNIIHRTCTEKYWGGRVGGWERRAGVKEELLEWREMHTISLCLPCTDTSQYFCIRFDLQVLILLTWSRKAAGDTVLVSSDNGQRPH